MTNIDKARELVKAHAERVHLLRVEKAQKLIDTADVNIVDRATRGLRYAEIGLCDYNDPEVIGIAVAEIKSNGYTVARQGNCLRIEW